MDDTAALRRTLRRCTAVLVVVLGVIAAYSAPYGPDTSIGYPLAYAASAYLGASLLAGLLGRAGDSTDGDPDSGSPECGGGDESDDAGGGSGTATDSEDEETADGDEIDQPRVSAFGGGHW